MPIGRSDRVLISRLDNGGTVVRAVVSDCLAPRGTCSRSRTRSLSLLLGVCEGARQPRPDATTGWQNKAAT
ncbi:hypothetical protein HPB47_010532 [Ixodes persulcatus]|uniref:Uncharacterized protein n=1 Tax=Ixodes persulcatus TaxID=34615 RepID=A0AC60NYT3_IXOPE|nr:hypothetical protein HPB47_010532 [Ixodes persulcatus]